MSWAAEVLSRYFFLLLQKIVKTTSSWQEMWQVNIGYFYRKNLITKTNFLRGCHNVINDLKMIRLEEHSIGLSVHSGTNANDNSTRVAKQYKHGVVFLKKSFKQKVGRRAVSIEMSRIQFKNKCTNGLIIENRIRSVFLNRRMWTTISKAPKMLSQSLVQILLLSQTLEYIRHRK